MMRSGWSVLGVMALLGLSGVAACGEESKEEPKSAEAQVAAPPADGEKGVAAEPAEAPVLKPPTLRPFASGA